MFIYSSFFLSFYFSHISFFFFFFFNDTATTEIYTLSLHDALPICFAHLLAVVLRGIGRLQPLPYQAQERGQRGVRSEEHTSELQSQSNLVCRLLLEKKKKKHITILPQNIDIRRDYHCLIMTYTYTL